MEQTWRGPDLTQVVDVTRGATQTFVVDTASHMVDLVTTTGAPTVRNFWGAAHLYLDSVRVGSDTATRYTYQTSGVGRGRVTTVTDPSGHTTTAGYAATGFQNQDLVQDVSRKTTFTHDAYGRLFEVRDPLIRVVAAHRYDLRNRDTLTVGAINDTTRARWGPLFLDTLFDAKGQAYRFTHDALGRVTQHAGPTGLAADAAYDSAGHVVQATNRRGQAVTMTYDALGRLRTRSATGVADTLWYASDDRWLVARTAEGRDSTVFDAAGRPVAQVVRRGAGGAVQATLGWRYDAAGRVTHRLLTAGGTTDTVRSFHGDAATGAGTLDSLVDFTGRTTRYSYTADHVRDAVELPNGVVASSAIPSTHRASELAYSGPAGVLPWGRRVGYDTTGRIANVVRADSVEWRYSYDAAGQLAGLRDYNPGFCTPVDESNAPGSDPAYAYKCVNAQPRGPFRSITSDKIGHPTGTAITVVQNRLLSDSLYTYQHDQDGNVTRKYRTTSTAVFDQTLTWDPLGRLTQVATSGTGAPATGTVHYGYDADGNRVRRTVVGTGATSYFVWDGAHVAVELDASGARVATYAYGPGVDEPVAARLNGARVYYSLDASGNVVGLTDSTGAAVARYEYTPFGLPELTTGTMAAANALRWKGRELDATTGLYYVRARWYDPANRRFVSEDPIGLVGRGQPVRVRRERPD